MIRDYDHLVGVQQCIAEMHWNRPELIRDYDGPVWFSCSPPRSPLKQTWIDKGLRRLSAKDRCVGVIFYWNRPELIRDYDPVLVAHGQILLWYWNRPELIRDYDPHCRWWSCRRATAHWNRPELIRDYDPLNAFPRQAASYSNWNRPELIRDYDQPSGVAHFIVYTSKLKQTWIDKGLRRIAVFVLTDNFTGQLKQTWIDKGLRHLNVICLNG